MFYVSDMAFNHTNDYSLKWVSGAWWHISNATLVLSFRFGLWWELNLFSWTNWLHAVSERGTVTFSQTVPQYSRAPVWYLLCTIEKDTGWIGSPFLSDCTANKSICPPSCLSHTFSKSTRRRPWPIKADLHKSWGERRAKFGEIAEWKRQYMAER